MRPHIDPDSLYSCLEIHICWKVSEDRMDSIQTQYLRSGRAMILIFKAESVSEKV